MEQKDIQELFTYIKGKLPKAKPKTLTPRIAAAWCKEMDGYTLEQLKCAVDDWTALKPFWPDADELKALLPPPPEKRTFPGWPAYGYRDVDDYREQMQSFIRRSREEDAADG
ncbi:hypothetical protein KL86CLO1_10468 [uncultured Eubacteriales bacterium]|uniref:Uncharacterized protein n=1 Tax=uncultured Eubacteriales bacterium TaxID=172733 RepID=A0A212J3S8_9FIRM|nr:hypothetical protein KL86CLO1_10468 [uncultured Eubacteriales bacterium]